MATILVNNNEQIDLQPMLLDAQIFSLPGEESEIDLNGKESLIKPLESSAPSRLWSDFSSTPSGSNRNKKSKSRSYKFVQLERALISAKLLNSNEDRIKFENEYFHSITKNKFDEFLQIYYEKIRLHSEQIKRERQLKQAQIFTFVDLERNFLALDPTRDVKILFLDEPTSSSSTKIINTRATASAHQRSTSAATDAAVESFYAKRSDRLLANPSYARDEITLFARRTAERLQERLPRLTSVPHRVKILDQRDITGKPDERLLLQLKHKRALSVINQRRHVIFKMMTQTKKNRIQMEEQWNPTSLAIDNSAYCRELLERTKQIEQNHREEQIRQRPQTTMTLRRIPGKNISSSAPADITTMNTNIINSFSSSSTPFQDSLSLNHIEKTKNIRVLRSTRPLTAPTKVNWVNYC